MVHIYTFSDKTLVGKSENKSATTLCENLFKLNFIIDECSVFGSGFNYEKLTFKNKDLYFFLMQRTSTKLNEMLASLSSCNLCENQTLKKTVMDFFAIKNTPIDKVSEKEWLIPESALPITNPNGITQGYLLKIGETTIFVLPNNFYEFQIIYNDCLLNYLEENFAVDYKSETYKTFGLSEEVLFNILKDNIKNKDKVSITIFSKGLENDIVIKSKQNNEKFNEYRQQVFDKLEKYIYAVQPTSLDEYLNNLLVSNNVKLSLVGDESINSILSNINIETIKSNIVEMSMLPNKNAKIQYGIDANQINQFGESSAEVVYSMAVKSLDNNRNTELVLSCVTNIKDNCGTTFIAIGNKLKIDIYKNQFYGQISEIVKNVSQTAKFYLIKKLKARDFKTI